MSGLFNASVKGLVFLLRPAKSHASGSESGHSASGNMGFLLLDVWLSSHHAEPRSTQQAYARFLLLLQGLKPLQQGLACQKLLPTENGVASATGRTVSSSRQGEFESDFHSAREGEKAKKQEPLVFLNMASCVVLRCDTLRHATARRAVL